MCSASLTAILRLCCGPRPTLQAAAARQAAVQPAPQQAPQVVAAELPGGGAHAGAGGQGRPGECRRSKHRGSSECHSSGRGSSKCHTQCGMLARAGASLRVPFGDTRDALQQWGGEVTSAQQRRRSQRPQRLRPLLLLARQGEESAVNFYTVSNTLIGPYLPSVPTFCPPACRASCPMWT